MINSGCARSIAAANPEGLRRSNLSLPQNVASGRSALEVARQLAGGAEHQDGHGGGPGAQPASGEGGPSRRATASSIGQSMREVGIVPDDTRLGVAIVIVGALVLEVGDLGQNEVAVRVPRRNPELVLVLVGENRSRPSGRTSARPDRCRRLRRRPRHARLERACLAAARSGDADLAAHHAANASGCPERTAARSRRPRGSARPETSRRRSRARPRRRQARSGPHRGAPWT